MLMGGPERRVTFKDRPPHEHAASSTSYNKEEPPSGPLDMYLGEEPRITRTDREAADPSDFGNGVREWEECRNT